MKITEIDNILRFLMIVIQNMMNTKGLFGVISLYFSIFCDIWVDLLYFPVYIYIHKNSYIHYVNNQNRKYFTVFNDFHAEYNEFEFE